MKKYDFDQIVDRHNTNCIKYDGMRIYYKSNDYIPMWVADMDFPCAQEITDALAARCRHGIFGYNLKPKEYYQSIHDFYLRRHGLEMRTDRMLYTPGVVPAIHWSLLCFTQPGDGVTILTPVYGPFEKAVKTTGRTLLESPLKNNDGHYVIDFDDLDEKLSRSKVLLFCSPHNPVARVWTRQELQQVAQLCEKHNVLVISDEIHCDFVMPGHKHIPFVNVSEEAAQRTVLLVSPSKTFNVAGLLAGTVYIPNEELFAAFRNECAQLNMYMTNIFTAVGVQAAYEHGDEWLDQVLEYVYANYNWACAYFRENEPRIRPVPLEGTYLMWLDCRGVSRDDAVLKDIFEERGRVAGEAGTQFGSAGSGYYRLNLACPRSVLEKAVIQMVKALKESEAAKN